MPKKTQPQISPIPPEMSDKHPRVRGLSNSSSQSCGMCEMLAVPPALPWLRVKGISVNTVLAQLLCRRKGFLGVWVLLAGQPCDGGEEASPRNAWGAGSDLWGPRGLSAPDPELGRTSGRPLAEERLELRQLPTAQLCSWFSSIAKPGLALLFLELSQGITLLSLFWEKEAFRSVGALWRRAWLVLGRVLDRLCCRAGSANDQRRRLLRACTHTHVHSPENGEELIPEANLFCSNPVAVTGSPQVLGSGAAADHIAFIPSPGASLSHSPVADGGERTSEKGRHCSQRLFTSPPRTRGVRR